MPQQLDNMEFGAGSLSSTETPAGPQTAPSDETKPWKPPEDPASKAPDPTKPPAMENGDQAATVYNSRAPWEIQGQAVKASYAKGFAEKCAEYGVDPQALLKTAEWYDVLIPRNPMQAFGGMSGLHGYLNPVDYTTNVESGLGEGLAAAGGGLLGATGLGALGNYLFGDAGKTGGVITGSVLGSVIGSNLGRELLRGLGEARIRQQIGE